jgi:hypothetical protein
LARSSSNISLQRSAEEKDACMEAVGKKLHAAHHAAAQRTRRYADETAFHRVMQRLAAIKRQFVAHERIADPCKRMTGMKGLVAAAALAWAGAALAAGPPTLWGTQHHQLSSLTCSECHVMHASRQHAFFGQFEPSPTALLYNQGTGHANLLIADGTNATCLACHDAPFGTNTDVFKTNTTTLNGFRSAGALNGTVAGHEDNTVYQDYFGHTLGSTATPPGWDADANGAYDPGNEGFTCSFCHAVHGGAQDAFRNLGGSAYVGPAPLRAAATNPFKTKYPTIPAFPLAAGTFDTSVDVMVWAAADRPAGAGTSSRDARNVVFGKGSGNVNGANGMNNYCANCHGMFHGATTTNAVGEHLKHPTSGSEDVVARMAAGGAQFDVTRPVYTANDRSAGEIGCLTCHKAHGNKHAFALIWPANGTAEAATTSFEEGDGTAFPSLCATCHSPASAYRSAQAL